MPAEWFPLGVGGGTFSRITLDFGLRGANQHFLELIVPGIGGARFVRQLSWAVAGLALRDTLWNHGERHRATPLANAIEAVACKAEYLHTATKRSSRIIGRRAFARDGEDVSSFQELKDRRHYVQNTFRGSIVRALRDKGGLGFASGARFDAMKLEPVGESLAAALLDDACLGQGSPSLRTWMRAWVGGRKEASWRALREVLSPETPTKRERVLVRNRLLEVEGPDAQKRRDLAAVVEAEPEFSGVEHVSHELRRRGSKSHAQQVELAAAFGAMLDACIDVIVQLSVAVEDAGYLALRAAAGAAAAQLAGITSHAKRYLARERVTASGAHTAAHAFAATATAVPPTALLEDLLRRERRVVDLLDGVVHKGPLFRNLSGPPSDVEDEDVSEEASESGRTFRLARFYELVRDTEGR